MFPALPSSQGEDDWQHRRAKRGDEDARFTEKVEDHVYSVGPSAGRVSERGAVPSHPYRERGDGFGPPTGQKRSGQVRICLLKGLYLRLGGPKP